MIKLSTFKESKITYILILINIVIFIIQSIFPTFTEQFMLNSYGSDNYSIHQYITSCFLHGSSSHLLFNMVSLYFLGTWLEKEFGRNNFLYLYLISGILANILFHLIENPIHGGLGASGCIFGIFAALATYSPNVKVLLFFIIPIKIKYLFLVIIGYEIYSHIYPSFEDNAGHIVHVLGAVCGILFYTFFIRNKSKK